MRPISNKKHTSFITVLKLLSEEPDYTLNKDILHSQIVELQNIYNKYELLLQELSKTIKEYELLHHQLKTDILAPALRTAKRKGDTGSDTYSAAIDYIKISRLA